MLEDGRCSLCEIPEHHSTAIPLPPPVAATPSTTRRHARHVHQAAERKLHTQHSDIGEIRLHANHMRHSSSPEVAPVSDHKHHTLSQFTNLVYTPRHALNEEPIYSSRSRHAVNEEPTFIQELSSYMKKNQHSYDGGSSRNLNNNDLNYNQNPNALTEEQLYGYTKDPSYKINNLPHPSSRSNSFNNQILNPKGLYTPNSRLHESNKSNTLPTNMLPGRRGNHASSMQDVDQDYFYNMSRSRFSMDGLKKRETRKQRITVQSVMLIGCFSLLFVVGIIMFVAVCYQNGWLGLGQEDPQEELLSRRRNQLNRRYDPIGNFPDNVHRQRGTGSSRIHNEYPRIGLSGVRRQQPSIYEDRDYQQSQQFARRSGSQQFARRSGHQAVDNHPVNNPRDELSTAYQQLPRFERLVDDRIGDNQHANSPKDELPQAASLVDNHPISTIPSNLLHDGGLAKENLQTSSRNEEPVTNNDQLNLALKLAFTEDENHNFHGMGQNLKSQSHLLQERVVINVPHHSIELSHNENFENIPASKVDDKVANMHGLEIDEETDPIDQPNKSLINKSDISYMNSSTSSSSVGSKPAPLQNHENSPNLSNSEGSKTVPLKTLSHLLKAESSRSKILSVVAGVLLSSDPT